MDAEAQKRSDWGGPVGLAATRCQALILGFATQGAGGNEEDRLRTLLRNFSVEIFPFDRRSKARTFVAILRLLLGGRFRLAVAEGTGVAGGMAVLLGRIVGGVPYVVSSGDAVAPYLTTRIPWMRLFFGFYELWLYRWAAGFIGWTPYLTGRALELGVPRAMTAAGWAPFPLHQAAEAVARTAVRERLGIPPGALVIGIVGSLAWSRRAAYCYGRELVQAIGCCRRPDTYAVIVGDGDGLSRLESLAGSRLNRTVFLVGRVPQRDVPAYLAAFDLASLPQSVDRVGGFRYTTKLSEYLEAGVPVVTGQIPMAYDLDDGWLWRLPGQAPWDPQYVDALADLLTSLTGDELAAKRAAVPRAFREFDRVRQVARVTAFLGDVLDEQSRRRKR